MSANGYWLIAGLMLSAFIWLRTYRRFPGWPHDLQRLLLTAFLTGGYYSSTTSTVFWIELLFGSWSVRPWALVGIAVFFVFYLGWFSLWRGIARRICRVQAAVS